MRPSRQHCLCALLALLAVAFLAPRARADILTVTSTPSGATVEIDGVVAGTTPFHVTYPGGFFHKPHTVFGSRLDHAMDLRVSLDGYATRRITLTDGPFEWIAVTGRREGTYFLLRSNHFDVKLDPETEAGSGTTGNVGPLRPADGLLSETDSAEPSESGSVSVESDPSGAEIYADGNFMGQTPSTIRLAIGPHRIVVKSTGRENWVRSLKVTRSGHVTLLATWDSASSPPATAGSP